MISTTGKHLCGILIVHPYTAGNQNLRFKYQENQSFEDACQSE